MTLDRKTKALLLTTALAALVPLRPSAAPPERRPRAATAESKARDAEGTTAHLHHQKGVACGDCHGLTKRPAPAASERCLACHGPYERVVERTASLRPLNPHDSPHWGADIECAVCHRQHERTVNWCAHCHTVANEVP